MAIEIQLFCKLIMCPMVMIGRAIVQMAQFSLTVYAVKANQDAIVYPSIIIAFGALILSFATLDILIDIYLSRQHRG